MCVWVGGWVWVCVVYWYSLGNHRFCDLAYTHTQRERERERVCVCVCCCCTPSVTMDSVSGTQIQRYRDTVMLYG